MRPETEVVLGIDLGTTATKAVAFDAQGAQWADASADYPLDEPRPGEAVQDPDEIVRPALEATRQAAGQARGRGGRIAALSFSAAMHSLIALNDRDRALTPSITWADGRAGEEAERLLAAAGGLALHRRTGTPLHPMSPLPKLVWFREHEPALFAAARRWVGIKEYVLAALTGRWAVDHSIASATGLLDLDRLDWDREALALARIDRTQLPDLVPATQVFDELRPDVAGHLGLHRRTPVVVGAGDGPLANVGVGAVRPGVAACSIGTSGALRVMVERPSVDQRGRVFCYALTPGRWVVGGAINNGGVVLQWTGEALAPDLCPEPEAELVDLAARAPAGSGGLIMLPYLLSERAPHWSSLPRGAYIGLTRAHRREHLVRAALEGVCQQLAVVLESMREVGNDVREVRATGGFARSALWRQILADALGMEIGFPAGHEGSGFGAALLGFEALGRIESMEVAADLVRVEDVTEPDPEAAAVYAALLPTFARLYDDLSPAYRALHDFGARPAAPAEPEPEHGRGAPRAS